MSRYVALSTPSGGSLASPSPLGGKSRAQMEKAALQLFDPAPDGNGTGGSRGSIAFQFNPKEVTIQKAAKWERKTAKGATKAGPPEFSGSEPCKLSLEILFDASGSHDGSVVEAVEKLFACTVPTEQSVGQQKPSPPLVVLQWGPISSFPAFITSVSAKYTLFTSDGLPIRASCSLSLEEMPSEAGRQNPTSGSDSVRRSRTLVEGDSLASIAYAEYGDPAAWRAVARFNGIDDPLRCRAGTRVVLPPPEEL